MKKLLIVSFLVLLFSFPVLASNNVVSYDSEVVTAFDPYDYDSQVNVTYHNDVAVNVYAGHGNQVKVFAVSEPQYCSHDQLVSFVNQAQVRVIVRRGILARLGLRLNQTVVNCVQTTKVNNKVVKQVVVKQVKVSGFLVGNNARRVKVAVASCR